MLKKTAQLVERNIPKWQNMIFVSGLFGSAFLTLCCVLLLLEWNTNHPVIFNFQDRTGQVLKEKVRDGSGVGSVRAWSFGNMKIWKRIQLWIVANRCCLGSITLFLKTETVFIFCYQYSYIGRPPLSPSTSHETSQDKILAAPLPLPHSARTALFARLLRLTDWWWRQFLVLFCDAGLIIAYPCLCWT